MKAVTIQNQSGERKWVVMAGVGGIALVVLAGAAFFFFRFQRATRANEERPANIQSQPASTSSHVKWNTPKEAIAVIEYGNVPDPMSFTSRVVSDKPSINHEVDLSDLKPNTTYYFQIKIGDETYDNDGQYFVFHTASINTPTPDPSPTTTLIPTATLTLTPTPVPSIASAEARISTSSAQTEASPTAQIILTPLVTTTPTTKIKLTPTYPPAVANAIGANTYSPICSSTNCNSIRANLGTLCTTQDYIRCIKSSTPASTATSTPTPLTNAAASNTPTTSISTSTDLKKTCAIDYVQANNCRSFTWNAMTAKESICSNTYTKYFVQCKNTSWTSTDPATWYCNQTTTGTDLSIPCGTAPTPIPGQSIFCRVRAETEKGGSDNATDWVYSNTSCATLSTNMSQCAMKYINANSCKTWSWDNVVLKDPACAAGFDHYFLQCTSNGDFSGSTGTWHCNKTFTDPSGDFPCYSAPTPADGATLTCRVRAEDAYGTNSHATDWVSASGTCPTSTPTPTFTPSPTPTNTPTSTPTPTP